MRKPILFFVAIFLAILLSCRSETVLKNVTVVHSFESSVSDAKNLYTPIIRGSTWFDYVSQTKIDKQVLIEVAKAEGNRHYWQGAKIVTSPVGAIGLMQIMPINFEQCGGEDVVRDPIGNIYCGDTVLYNFLEQSNGNLRKALQWYNGGYKINEKSGVYADKIIFRLNRQNVGKQENETRRDH